MRTAHKDEMLLCPFNNEAIPLLVKGVKVWDAHKPDGNRVTYAPMPRHHHRGVECEYQSPMVGEVVRNPVSL